MTLATAARALPESLLQRVRRETAVLHSQIEKVVGITRPDVSRADYVGYLATFRGYTLPLERRLRDLSGLHATLPDLERRWKAPRLEGDLRALGFSEAALRTLPICDRLPRLGTVSRALGCLYVLEGSTLGGQVLQRLLRARLPAELAAASAFLGCYGTETGSMWKEFGERLTVHAASVADEEDVIAAAVETFATLTRWFERSAPR